MIQKVMVSDTNIWIDLEHGGILEQVFALPYHFVTTDFVWDELHQPSGASVVALGLEIEELDSDVIERLFELKRELNNSSLADVSCYYLAVARNWVLLTGDGAVRKAGLAKDIEVHGVLWLMDCLFDLQLVDGQTLCNALEAMLEGGARLPRDKCDIRLEAWQW